MLVSKPPKPIANHMYRHTMAVTRYKALAYNEHVRSVVRNVPKLLEKIRLLSRSNSKKPVSISHNGNEVIIRKRNTLIGENHSSVYSIYYYKEKDLVHHFFLKELKKANPISRELHGYNELIGVETLKKIFDAKKRIFDCSIYGDKHQFELDVVKPHFAFVDASQSYILYDYKSFKTLRNYIYELGTSKGIHLFEQRRQLEEINNLLKNLTKIININCAKYRERLGIPENKTFVFYDIESENIFVDIKNNKLLIFDPWLTVQDRPH